MSRMTTYIQQGARVTIVAPSDIAAGDAVKIGDNFYGVADRAIGSGAEGVVNTEGVYAIVAGTSGVSAGAPCYITSGAVTLTSGAGTRIGRALNTVSSGGIAQVLLNK